MLDYFVGLMPEDDGSLVSIPLTDFIAIDTSPA
jgi:hypothetical protein